MRVAAALDLARRLIEHEIADDEHRRRQRTRPPRQRFDARQQLLERKGLGDVVVGAGSQRGDLGVDRVLRGQHEHGPLEAARAEHVQQLEPDLPGRRMSRTMRS